MCIEILQKSKCANRIRKDARRKHFDFFQSLNKSKYCKKLESSCSILGCLKEKTICQKQTGKENNGFKPTCDENGNFADIQSDGSIQWCPIIPKLSAEPLGEKFKIGQWEENQDSDYKKWTKTCAKLKNSKCAQELTAKAGNKFSMKKAVKKSKSCKKLIKDRNCTWKNCRV